MPSPSIAIRGGRVVDGSGAPGRDQDVLIESGTVRALLSPGHPVPPGTEEIDARDCWVTPGFIDLHTHYDAEIEVAPGLAESVRHGVTTVAMGSCGVSMAVGEVEDLADLYCRVEGIPRPLVLPLLEAVKDWDGPAAYADHLDGLALGPNVCLLLGHSTIRAEAMGLGRSVAAGVRPTAAEMGRMRARLEEALDAGYLGLSVNKLSFDKVDGDRYRGQRPPSCHARWREYRDLADMVRHRGRVLQGAPDIRAPWTFFWFPALSSGLGRKPLRTMVISMLDSKRNRGYVAATGMVGRVTNALLRGELRFQSLPTPFDVWVDGLDVPLMEELGAGSEALNVSDPAQRMALLGTSEFRRRFRRDWRNPFAGHVYHRDLDQTLVVDCPDATLIGRSFGDIATERGQPPVETFLDLQAEWGEKLRWYTVVGNDRSRTLERITAHPSVLVGFSDAGAHLRNMAYYNFPLRMLKRVRDAEQAGRPFLTLERAIHRLTGEIADFLGIDAGRIAAGRRADLAVVDPAGLTGAVEETHEAPVDGLDGLQRLVRRNDDAVRAVLVNGRVVWGAGRPGPALGRSRLGRVLAAG